MVKKRLFEALREENRKLKEEVDTLRRGAREASDAVDAILITAAATLGRPCTNGDCELILPFPDVKECREKYKLSAEKTENGEIKIKVTEKP